MHSVQKFALLAAAASVAAVPHNQHKQLHHDARAYVTNTHYAVDVVYQTQTVTEGQAYPTPEAAPPAQTPSPAEGEKPHHGHHHHNDDNNNNNNGGGNVWSTHWETHWTQGPAPTPTPEPTTYYQTPTPSPTTQYQTPTPEPTSGGGDASGGLGDYMSVVSKWRKLLGKGELTRDSKLEANAAKTCIDGNGQMVHELNPGSMAQVLAPGEVDDFLKVFVGGWLCEVPSLPGLNGICVTMKAGWDHSDGETGHADILVSDSYTKIGCALEKGIWGCDLA